MEETNQNNKEKDEQLDLQVEVRTPLIHTLPITTYGRVGISGRMPKLCTKGHARIGKPAGCFHNILTPP